ncbi:glycerol-3-phosphate 1-O-acyltransferase PlsY [Robertmurraya korlensis]|uniref:glycerol-3-phosphate 1-O-acyltransferase PlsY n=1 Tax=Robertmurraya korlensis TaxID=519977 RepID=UPI00203CD4A1|nr:glycerol-3-phosphate 1-O-acyltransferase PlsY [Robertmurraya korlensis]MCM3602807.1 glycerol-3-phosphate 1-O-acyltransferase PlsY [Robertmurraya korlensis]
MEYELLIIAYLLGSIPTALLVGKWLYQVDIRTLGSNNPGATNTIRVLGKKAGIIVLLVDVGKGALATYLPILLHSDFDPLYAGLLAVIGHCFPIFAGFRGGKAIATTAGFLIVYNPVLFLVTFLTFFIVIFVSKYVFFGSISVGIAMLIYSLFEEGYHIDLIFFLFLLLLFFLHRTNIRNYLNSTELKINDKKLKDDRIPPKPIK